MFQSSLASTSNDNLRFEREKVRWPVYIIALLGLFFNFIYFGIEWVTEPIPLREHFIEDLPQHLIIVSMIVLFPLVAFMAHHVVAGYRLSEYSRRLESEMKVQNEQLVDLMNFSENIMNSVNDLIFVIGSDGRFQFVGGNCLGMIGCEPGSLVGRQFIELVAPGSVAKAVSSFESILRGIDVPPYEVEVRGSGGDNKYIEISSTAYQEDEGISAQVGVARDVTERKRLEQHVIKRNRELAALNTVAAAIGHSLELDDVLSSALDQMAALTQVDRAGIYLYNAVDRALELKASRGRGWEESDRIVYGEGAIGRAAEKGSPVLLNIEEHPEEMSSLACDEEVVSLAAIPIKYSGRLVGMLAVASGEPDNFPRENIDLLKVISSQIAMAVENALLYQDAQLKASELADRNRELALATDEISNLIAVAEIERSFSVRSKNQHLVKCWEVKDCTQVDCPSYKSQNLRCWQVAGTHCGGQVQGVFAQKFGQCEKCEVYRMARPNRLTAIGESFNNMMAMLERKVEEQQQLQEQLVQSTKLAAIGELAANIAHEINNPLTGVLSHAALLSRSLPAGDPVTDKIEVITNETLRARDIVRNLLDFSRKESLKKQKISITQIMDETLLLVRQQAELANIEIKLHYAADLPSLYVDPNQMKQIFINIINNALYAIQTGGILTITIEAEKPESRRPWVEISFSDNGKGIPPDKLGKVFDPFFTSKDAGEGTGLGLSISKRMVEEHGGSIEVKSRVGEGSTFIVKLPTANISTNFHRVA